jgi:type IV pilus assembly protein PilQ
MVRKGNIIRIAPIELIQAERQREVQARDAAEKLKPLFTKIVPVNYGAATEIMARLKTIMSPRGKAEVDKRTNSIIIRDIQEKLDEAQAMIAALDTPTPQVLIEARVVEASVGITRQIGVQWGANYKAGPQYGTPTGLNFPSTVSVGGAVLGGMPAGSAPLNTSGLSGGGGALGLSFGSLTGVADLDLVLQALESQNKAKVISSPRVMTVNNNTATIEQGVTIPYPPAASLGGAAAQWTFVEASLRLEVTPQVSADKSIVLKVKVSNNQPNQKVVSGGAPSIDKKEAQTEILIHDGDTAVIGGIYKISKSDTITQVPFLSRLPGIGYLFKTRLSSNSNDELLVFLTPRIIEAGGASTTKGI